MSSGSRFRPNPTPSWAQTQNLSSLKDWEADYNDSPPASPIRKSANSKARARPQSPPSFNTSLSPRVSYVPPSSSSENAQKDADEAFFNMLRSDEPPRPKIVKKKRVMRVKDPAKGAPESGG